MKPYGFHGAECRCCCPGHDKFASGSYNNRRSKRAHTRDTVLQHQTARARLKAELLREDYA